MNKIVRAHPDPVRIGASACPHDCPSTCALEVDVIDERTIGRVRGAPDNAYTAGVICAKVARYAERIHHPDRLTQPLRRAGAKGSGEFTAIGWDDALDLVAEAFLKAERGKKFDPRLVDILLENWERAAAVRSLLPD